ncbi:Zn-dependent oligopeptidase [bacterium]|nr:Zn-dependent oligopeptidase [bacterium]
MRKMLALLIAAGIAFIGSCATSDAPKQEEKKDAVETQAAEQAPADQTPAQEEKKEDFGELGNKYLAECRTAFQAVKETIADIKANPEGRTSVEKLQLFNKFETIIEDTWGKIGIYEMNHPDEGIRNAAMLAESELMSLVTEINLDADLYKVAAAIPADDPALDDQDKHFLGDLIDDFKRSGVDKDDATRAEIKKTNAEAVELEQKFNANIAADRKVLKFTVEQLKGMPESFINAKPKDENGMIMLSTDYPDYFPIMEYADNEDVRKQMYMTAQNVAFPQNTEIFANYLKAKAKFAKLLGYKNWAELSEAKMMIENPEKAKNFLDKIIPISMKYAKRDAEILLAKKKQLTGKDDVEVEPWDRFYIPRLVRMEKFSYNPQEAEQYFEMQKVINGIFIVNEKIFGLKFEKVKRDDVWHESVMSFDVYSNGEKIGEFELDLYPRPNKYKHFAMFTNVQGIKGRLPRMAIVGNFPEPVNGKSYISHDNVQTLFHEFGHLINGILAREYKYVRFAGTNCQRDFVEVPSQFMEEYVWDPAILQLWATNDAGEPIPTELVEKMKKSDEFGKGLHVSRQLYLAKLSLELFLQNPEGFDHHAFEKQLEKEFSPWKSYEETHQIENFGHLVNYTSNYYTYMWSLAIVKDIYGYIMKNGGLMNTEIMGKYRDTILKLGGNKSGNEMIKDFTGGEPSLEEFEKWLNN